MRTWGLARAEGGASARLPPEDEVEGARWWARARPTARMVAGSGGPWPATAGMTSVPKSFFIKWISVSIISAIDMLRYPYNNIFRAAPAVFDGRGVLCGRA